MAEKQAACFNCKRGKMKCLHSTAGGSPDCVGCIQRGLRCIRPAYRLGRNPGSKNKLSGLERAIYQIENAMSNEASSSRHDRQLLNQFLFKIGSRQSNPAAAATVKPRVRRPSIPMPKSSREAIDAAENPLLLLAQTLEGLSVETEIRSPAGAPALASRRMSARPQTLPSYNEEFFGPFKPIRDTDPELDPVMLGLVDMVEAEQLFSYFYQNLSEMRWGLDPVIHTPKFVHQQSLFLFTSVLAVSALFIASAGTLSTRLQLHCRKLADIVIKKRMRSVEIVLAFMLNVPWLTPGTHWADDETWIYLSAASTIALDIFLDKIIVHPGAEKNILEWRTSHQSECIHAHKVMDLDGFSDVDITSEWGRRLLRRRERAWLTLWGLERGVCLARGRRWSVPVTPLIEFCDNWHVSDIAATWDDSIGPAMVLRRDLLPFIENLKANFFQKAPEESTTDPALEIHQEIEWLFQNWMGNCPRNIVHDTRKLPPYVDILSSHTRLSAYAHLINLPTASAAVRKQFRAAAFSASLSVLHTAVRREAELIAMPNNSVIMVTFSAAFAIQITSFSEKGTSSLTSSVITLIGEVANVLERIGTVTPHRNGIAALFAVHLRRIVQLASSSIASKGYPEELSIANQVSTRPKQNDNGQSSSAGLIGAPGQPVHLSDISIDKIKDMIDSMGDDLGEYSWDFNMDFSLPDPDLLDCDYFS